MAYRYVFSQAAARDLAKLTRRDHPLLLNLVTVHIPAILADPHAAGQPKRGDLSGVRAYPLTHNGVAYRLVYTIEAETVRFIAIGPHDEAYRRAARR